jgi:hypothetical protein
MNTLISNNLSGRLARPSSFQRVAALGSLLVVGLTALAPTTALAQPYPDNHRGDIHVFLDRGNPRFGYGPHNDDFVFVRGVPAGRFINSRDSLLDLLLRPVANAVAWGVGDIATIEVANLLGLPLHTTVYAVQAGVPVYTTVPQGYFVAESVPQNVALVTYTPQGPVVVNRCVPPGTFVAYQAAPNGVVMNECLVVPPVQQQIVVAAPPVTTVVTAAPTVAIAPQPATPAPAVTAAPATPAPEPAKVGQIVYDANGKPLGVIVTVSDGKTEFVPLQQ